MSKKTWAVEAVIHFVVCADTKDEAAAMVEDMCAEDPPTTLDATEITKLSELPGDWDKNCIPYGESELRLGELLEEDG